MKIIKVWSTFQTELKYHDHFLSEEMQKHGVETLFVSSDKLEKGWIPFLKNKKVSAGEDEYRGSKIIRLRSFEFFNKHFILEVGKLYRLLKSNDVQVLHLFGIGNFVTFLTLFIMLFRKNKPLIVANDHSNPQQVRKSLLAKVFYSINSFLFFCLGHQIKKVFVPNRSALKVVQQRYNIDFDKFKILPLGFDNRVFKHNQVSQTSSKLHLGFAGKIIPQKRLELLIEVLKELNNENIECTIVGINDDVLSAYQESLVKSAKGLNIHFKPLISKTDELVEFYNGIDVAVFPGSISITTIEANGCGTPVILYESIEGLEDRVDDERGTLFKSKEEFKTAILKYQTMKNDSTINRKAISMATQKYSWEVLTKDYLNEYSKLMDNQ